MTYSKIGSNEKFRLKNVKNLILERCSPIGCSAPSSLRPPTFRSTWYTIAHHNPNSKNRSFCPKIVTPPKHSKILNHSRTCPWRWSAVRTCASRTSPTRRSARFVPEENRLKINKYRFSAAERHVREEVRLRAEGALRRPDVHLLLAQIRLPPGTVFAIYLPEI